MYDCLIIGAGPAGVSASLYTKRANLRTLIIYNDKSNLEKTEKIENFYGFANGIDGKSLYEEGIKQAKNIGVEVINEEVLKIERSNNYFKISTTKNEYMAKTVIIATGNKKNTPNIKGIKEFEGKGISYCAICDGFFYRGKEVCVIGSGNYAISETNDLINLAKKVTILTNGKNPPDIRSENVDINKKEIEAIEGNEKVEDVRFKDNTKIKTEGIFIAEGIAGSVEFAKKLGIIMKNNKIVVNEKMQTNIKGIYACGDCTGGLLQISKSVYEGTIAGLQVIDYIKNN